VSISLQNIHSNNNILYCVYHFKIHLSESGNILLIVLALVQKYYKNYWPCKQNPKCLYRCFLWVSYYTRDALCVWNLFITAVTIYTTCHHYYLLLWIMIWHGGFFVNDLFLFFFLNNVYRYTYNRYQVYDK